MSNEPELTDLPIGHPLFTHTIHQGLEETTARLLGTAAFVETALNQADLFANQGKPEAIALALGEAATYLEYSRDAGLNLEDLLDDRDDDLDEDDEPDVMTLYRILPQALAAADQCSQPIKEAVNRYQA